MAEILFLELKTEDVRYVLLLISLNFNIDANSDKLTHSKCMQMWRHKLDDGIYQHFVHLMFLF